MRLARWLPWLALWVNVLAIGVSVAAGNRKAFTFALLGFSAWFFVIVLERKWGPP